MQSRAISAQCVIVLLCVNVTQHLHPNDATAGKPQEKLKHARYSIDLIKCYSNAYINLLVINKLQNKLRDDRKCWQEIIMKNKPYFKLTEGHKSIIE